MKSLHSFPTLLVVLLISLPSAADAALPQFGTPHLVKDLEPGPADSTIRFLLPLPNNVVFEREPAPSGSPPELWATDGTPGGAFRLQPPGLELPIAPVIWQTERFIYFDGMDATTKTRSIWRTDGTLEGTVKLADDLRFGIRSQVLEDRGLFLFVAGAPAADYSHIDWELWVTDGTAEGTRHIRDYVQEPNSRSSLIVEAGGDGYFLDEDPAAPGAIGLWHTDGTAAGTERVFSAPGLDFQRLWSTDHGLFLLARDKADSSTSFWFSNGSPAGTHEVKELGTPFGLAEPAQPLGDVLGHPAWTLFTESVSPSVWVSDGTAAGTERILELALNSFQRPDIGASIVPYRGLGYFIADDGGHGRTLWKTDGTPGGTEVAIPTGPENPGFRQTAFFPLKDLLFVERSDLSLGAEPWVSDGTASGTHLLGDLCPGACSSSPVNFAEVPGGAIFLAEGADSGHQLWATDLTALGTRRITHPITFSGGIETSPPSLLWNDTMLFVGNTSLWGKELYSMTVSGGHDVPSPPPGPWLRSDEVAGFEFKVRIKPSTAPPVMGSIEPACIPETACVSGALPGRSEVFIRVVGPKPNGFLWPTLVKFTTSQVEVWLHQLSTDRTRYYQLRGADPSFDELPGLFDRMGFEP